MKKFSIILFTILTAMLTVNVCASEVKVDIKREISGNVINNTVGITGSLGADHANRPMTLTIYKSGTSASDISNILYIEQSVSNSDGAASFVWSSSDEGDFTAKVRSGGCEHYVEDSFSLIGKNYYSDALSAFKSVSNASDVYAAMTEYASNIGISTKFYDSMDDKSTVANLLINKKSNITSDNLNDIITECIVFGFLNSTEPATEKNDLIVYYDESLLKLSGQADAVNIFSTYKNMDAAVQNEVLNKISGKADSFDNLRKCFNEAVVLTGIKMLSKEEIDKLITDNNDFIGFSGYESLDVTRKSYVISALIAANAPDMATLRNVYATALSGGNSQQGTVGSKPSGGGGGGGGSSGRGSAGGTSFTSSESYQNPAPEVVGDFGLYSDISEDHWAYKAVEYLSGKGIVKGYGDGSFGTDKNISRAEYIKLLTVAFDIPVNISGAEYLDVNKNEWYYEYVMSATSAGACEGRGDGTFAPNESITREDMATILYRLALQKALISFTEVGKSVFKDIDSVSEYAKNSVNTLGVAGIISGTGEGKFNPKATATRAEAAQLIYNLLSKQ